jgi:hypothetical protein
MTTAEKNLAISAAIVAHRAAGKTLPEAVDAVFGPGGYQQLAGMVWEILRESQGIGPAEKSA